MGDMHDAVNGVAQGFWEGILDYLIGASLALALLVIGTILAKAVEVALRFVLNRLRVDAYVRRVAEGAGFDGRKFSLPATRVISRIAFFVILLVFLQAGTREMGLLELERLFSWVLALVPNLLAAAAILLAGRWGGRWLGRAAGDTARASGLQYGRILGNLVSAFVMCVAGILALSQAGIRVRILDTLAVVVVASLALGFAFSFGTGSREVTRNILAGFYVRKHLKIGRTIEVAGHKGVLVSVAATQSTLVSKGKSILLANSLLFTEAVQQSEG